MKWGDYDDADDDSPSSSNLNSSTPSSDNTTKDTDVLTLQHTWVLWYDDGTGNKGQNNVDYENSIKQLGTFNTIQDFWRYWNNVANTTKLADYSNLRMFKKGIKPMWEDPANMEGGKWVVQCFSKDQTSSYTQKIALSIIGEQLEYGEDICGLVLSIRPKTDTINVWNRTSSNPQLITVTSNQLSQVIENTTLRYQAHKESVGFGKSPRGMSTPPPLRSSTSDEALNDSYKPRIPALTLDFDVSPIKSTKSPRNYPQSPLSKSGGYGPNSDPNRNTGPYSPKSNGYNKNNYNNHKDNYRDRENHRDRDKDKDKVRDRSGDRDNGRSRDRSRDRENNRDRTRDTSKDRDGSHNHRENHRDGRDSHRDNHRENHKDRDHKEKDKETTAETSTDPSDFFNQLLEQHKLKLNQSWADSVDDDEEIVETTSKPVSFSKSVELTKEGFSTPTKSFSRSQHGTPKLQNTSHPNFSSFHSSSHSQNQTPSKSLSQQALPQPASKAQPQQSQPSQQPSQDQSHQPTQNQTQSTPATQTPQTQATQQDKPQTNVPTPIEIPLEQIQAPEMPISPPSIEALAALSPIIRRVNGEVSAGPSRLRQEHKQHRKSRSVSVVEGQSEIINSILAQQSLENPSFDASTQSPLRTTTRRSSISLDHPLLNLPPLPPLPTQHLLSIIEPPLPSIPEFSSAASAADAHSYRRHKKSASVSQIGSVQTLLNPTAPPSSIRIGFTHRSPSQEALNVTIPRKKSASTVNLLKDPSAISPPSSFHPPSFASRRRSSLPPPLQGVLATSPKRHSGRITPVLETTSTYISPPSSARKATSSESERRSHSHKRASSVNDGKRIAIERPYFGDLMDGDDDDDDEADVAFRPDLSGATPVAPENFIRPIARRGSRSEKPIPAFFEAHATPERVSREVTASPARLSDTIITNSIPTPTSAGKRKKKEKKRSNSNASHQTQAASLATSKSKKWSISEFIGVIVLAIFVAAITLALQHSW